MRQEPARSDTAGSGGVKKPRPLRSAALEVALTRYYSPIVSSEALPPAAVVLIVSVRSPAKRNR